MFFIRLVLIDVGTDAGCVVGDPRGPGGVFEAANRGVDSTSKFTRWVLDAPGFSDPCHRVMELVLPLLPVVRHTA